MIRIKSLTNISLLLLTLFCLSCSNKKVITEDKIEKHVQTQEIKDLAAAVAKDDYIGTQSTMRMEGESPAYTRRMKLMNEAGTDGLLMLTGDPNAVVRAVAFEGLVRLKDPVVPTLLKTFMKDDAQIHYIKGDISKMMPLLEYCYTYALGFVLPGESEPDEIEGKTPSYDLESGMHTLIQQRIIALRES